MLEKAKERLEGFDVRLEQADARDLPYEDASFEVIASCFGVIFPPEREQVAAELGRVCRPGGRMGITAWLPDEDDERGVVAVHRQRADADRRLG